MKEGAVIINTARGELIDIQALLRALASGKIAAAGLDVLPEEQALLEGAKILQPCLPKAKNLRPCWPITSYCSIRTFVSRRTVLFYP